MKKNKSLPAIFLSLLITTIFIAQLSQPLAAQTRKRSGAITGQVITNDGYPAAEATVLACSVSANASEFQKVGCDDDGKFKLTGLKPGAYIISASLPGYVSSGSDIHRIGEQVTLTLVKGGVITGRVTDAAGEPMEGITINLQMIRDLEGRTISDGQVSDFEGNTNSTDDRGMYRIFGLSPGIYLASVIDTLPPEYQSSSFRHDSPTYYPSAKRAAAAEITVRTGEEVTGIDIHYRAEQEHSITGTISGEAGPNEDSSFITVTLRNEGSGEVEATTDVVGSRTFRLHGVADGTYEIVAQRFSENADSLISAPRRVTVKGADLAGINLRLLKTGSISGRLLIESPKAGGDCKRKEDFSVEEISLEMKKIDTRDHIQNVSTTEYDRDDYGHLTAPNEKGEFKLKILEAGVYRILSDLPDESWYIRAITRNLKGANRKIVNIAQSGITLASGENLTDVEIVVAEGAGQLRGRVITDGAQTKDRASTLPRQIIHLVPSEAEAAEDVSRYAETTTSSEGAFELKHLAPGKYFVLAREISGKTSLTNEALPVAWDNVERAKLRREAQALKQEIEFRPCQQINDYLLRVSTKPK